MPRLRPGAMSDDDYDEGRYDGVSAERADEIAGAIESRPDEAVGEEGSGWGPRWDHRHDSSSEGERHRRRNLRGDAIPDGYGDPRTW